MISFLASSALAASHLFIMSGQSNMERWDPDKKFVPTVRKLLKKDDVWHVKVAHGGKGIRHWVADWDQIAREERVEKRPDPVEPDYYDEIMTKVRAGIAEHGKPDSVTLVWVQGEADARRGWHAAYARSLDTLVTSLQTDLEVHELNVVVGRLSDFSPTGDPAREGWPVVRQAQMEFVKGNRRRGWVDADDLNDLGTKKEPFDDLHYSKKGYKVFAKRLAIQAARIVRGQYPVPSGRPE